MKSPPPPIEVSRSPARGCSAPRTTHDSEGSSRAFFYYAVGTLAYTVFVILLGSVVRITGSGAGCGQHWPSCQGELLPISPSIETAIEWTHRVTSGLSFIAVLGLASWALRRWPARHWGRRAALAALAGMVVEVLVGAGLVLLALVGNDDSIERALVMAVHLVNTFLLIACLAFVALLARAGGRAGSLVVHMHWPVLLGTLALLAAVTSGGMTALGDTVRPVDLGQSTVERVSQLYGATAHLLDRLRLLHPLLALGAAAAVVAVAAKRLGDGRPGPTALWARGVIAAALLQTALGVANVWLGAPGWLQVVHLSCAIGLWLPWLMLWASEQLFPPRTGQNRANRTPIAAP